MSHDAACSSVEDVVGVGLGGVVWIVICGGVKVGGGALFMECVNQGVTLFF